jgi:VWFA-related protein
MKRVAAFLLILISALHAASEPRQLTIKVGVDLVNILFTVTDGRGRLVSGLSKADFAVEEDGRKQEILHFSKENELPLTLALVIDTSPSIQPVFNAEKRTAILFLRSILRPMDLATVIGFDRSVTLMEDFTQNSARLAAAIRDLEIGGGTSLFDAVYLAAKDRLSAEAGRKAIILISDGDDTTSKLKQTDALTAAHQSDAVIYSIYITPPRGSRQRRGLGTLRKLSEETGGGFYSLNSETDFNSIFDQIGRELRSQYSLGYKSTNTAHDGKYRRIRILPRDRSLMIRARQGYYPPRDYVSQ